MAQLTPEQIFELQEIQNEINLKIANINDIYFNAIKERLEAFTIELNALENN